MRRNQKIPCPKCSLPMDCRAKFACRNCCAGGRPVTPSHEYARELGITQRRLIALGGPERLRAMSEDALRIMLGPTHYGNSRTVADGGMKARGMKRCVPHHLSQTFDNHP
jgi:hypothetical protein